MIRALWGKELDGGAGEVQLHEILVVISRADAAVSAGLFPVSTGGFVNAEHVHLHVGAGGQKLDLAVDVIPVDEL